MFFKKCQISYFINVYFFIFRYPVFYGPLKRSHQWLRWNNSDADVDQCKISQVCTSVGKSQTWGLYLGLVCQKWFENVDNEQTFSSLGGYIQQDWEYLQTYIATRDIFYLFDNHLFKFFTKKNNKVPFSMQSGHQF